MSVTKLPSANVDVRLERLAELLGAAIDGQRHRGVTKHKIAKAHGTHGSNLSAFVTSKGKVRNVGVGTVEEVLLALGLHANGTLTHGLHRWDLLDNRENVEGLGEVLKANVQSDGAVHRQPHLLELACDIPPIAFIVLRPSAATLLLARISASDARAVERAVGRPMVRCVIDVADSSELQSCWHLAEHQWLIPRSIARILTWPDEG